MDIPAGIKRRFGLDDERSLIVQCESNRLVWPGPDPRPVDDDTGYYGLCRWRCLPISGNVLLRLPAAAPNISKRVALDRLLHHSTKYWYCGAKE